MEIQTNPKVWGPGVWHCLNIMSINANTLLKAKLFYSNLLVIISSLPCQECKDHSFEFINNNDYNNYIDRKYKDIIVGPFIYINKLHNNANKITGNTSIEWLEAYKALMTNNVCTGPCGQVYNKLAKEKLSKIEISKKILNKFNIHSNDNINDDIIISKSLDINKGPRFK